MTEDLQVEILLAFSLGMSWIFWFVAGIAFKEYQDEKEKQ